MGKVLTYYILALAIILGLTYMASQAESCNKKSPVSIHANDLSADKPDEPTSDDFDDDDDEPMDEENDAVGKGSITSDEDADDDEVIAIEGDEEEFADDDAEVAEASRSTSSSNYGDYLVIAGAFKQKSNASAEVDRLQNSGYPNAEIVEFDYSDYYSVCVAKYNNRGDATAVANSIKSRSGKKAYVHKKRSKN